MKICFILCDTLRYDRVNKDTMPEVYELAQKGTSYSMFWGDGGNTKLSLPHYLSGTKRYSEQDSFPMKLTEHGIKNTIVHSNAILVVERYQNCFQKHVDLEMEHALSLIHI